MCDRTLRDLERARDRESHDCSVNELNENVENFRGYDAENLSSEWPPRLSSWCPRANVYYAYTEDANPFERVEKFIRHKLECPEKVNHQIHHDPPLEPFGIRDPYEENAARHKHLRDDPVSFVIFGKPGLDTEKLAELISRWWKCVLVSPNSLVRDEIDKDTDKGRWISESLENGENLDSNVFTNLIETRINQRDVMNRGYVVEGLPLIPENPESQSFTCPEDRDIEETVKCCEIDCKIKTPDISSTSSTSSDESITGFPASDNFKRQNIDPTARANLFLRRTTIEETLRELQVNVTRARINPFANESSANIVPEKWEDSIPKQIEAIFESWPLKPTVIIYVSCPDEDVYRRRENFDPFTENPRFRETGESPRDDLDDKGFETNLIERVSEIANCELRCEFYKLHALPVIERRILEHNPQNVINVDGRISISQMFQVVSTKLRSLPLSRAIIPHRIFDHSEDLEEQVDDDLERVFERLSRKFTITSMFRWTLSDWKFACPVELAQGRRIEGRAEYAVRFMNKIFFPSSDTSLRLFLDNPRPFVLSMRPTPSCKIAIFGPRYSGKSKLSEALARTYRSRVIDIRQLTREIIDERIEENVTRAIREARDRVINDLRVRLENERKNREISRLEALNNWHDRGLEILRRYDESRRENLTKDSGNEKLENTKIILKDLREHGLEFFADNDELVKSTIKAEIKIYDYAPVNLRDPEPPIRDLSEHDPEVARLLENEVRHLRDSRIEITNREIAGTLVSRIKMMPDERIDEELTREPGWIVDGMIPDPEIWRIINEAGVFIDDIILIRDQSPYGNLLRDWQKHREHERREIEEDETENEDNSIDDASNYIAEIEDFEEKWQNFSAFLEETGRNYYVCEFNETWKIYENVVRHIEGFYRQEAKIAIDDERDMEETIDTTDLDDDEDDGPMTSLDESTRKNDRRYGDTGIYCPVALAKNNILWKGKNEHAALFLEKIYLCSSDAALEEFLKNPSTFNVPREKPAKIPSAKIFIVGTPSSGKSTICEILSREFATRNVDFSECLKTYARDRGIIIDYENPEISSSRIDLPSDLNDRRYDKDERTILGFLRKYEREGASLPRKIFDNCVLDHFKCDDSPLIIDSFPNCPEDVEIALEHYAVPELIVELRCSLVNTRERLLPRLLELHAMNREDFGESENEEDEIVEETRERALRDIEEIYERKREMLERARMRMEEESVSWIIVDNDKDTRESLNNLRKIIRPLVARDSSSIFEQTHRLDPYKADELLDCGYFILSTFGRSCPVQMYEKKNPFHMYTTMDERNEILPILHRHYVYFVAGEKSAAMFENDPLKYIRQDSCDPILTAKVSIVGPRRSGKTTLAERLSRAYGLGIIERTEALRWIRRNYKWTRVAIETEESLRDGREITKKLFARVLRLYMTDNRSSCQGWILDGFPIDREETEEMALVDIRPMIVIDLRADRDFCLTSWKWKNDENTDPTIIAESYEKWQRDSPIFLRWLTDYAQNVVSVDATASKWAIWRKCDCEISAIYRGIKRYYREADYEKVHSLRYLCVTPYELVNRRSECEFFCPACLHYDETIKFSGSPPDRRGVVQFRRYFYWICQRHIDIFTKNPRECLPPRGRAFLPHERPQIINDEIDVEHACWAKRLVANGTCLVTYVDSQDDRTILPGKRNIATLYNDNLYLFCSFQCRDKFISSAAKYARIVIDVEKISIEMSNERLTNLEYLEKSVVSCIVKSIVDVAAKRPKYPGFSVALSAAIFIGIYLKINNVECRLNEMEIYRQVQERLTARERIVKIATRNIKKIINPHVNISKSS